MAHEHCSLDQWRKIEDILEANLFKFTSIKFLQERIWQQSKRILSIKFSYDNI